MGFHVANTGIEAELQFYELRDANWHKACNCLETSFTRLAGFPYLNREDATSIPLSHRIMQTIQAPDPTNHPAPAIEVDQYDHRLDQWIRDAAKYLPAQGPIDVFVHHNTLHAFQNRPFHEAVKLGLDCYGAQPYLSENVFRELRNQGQISDLTIEKVIERDETEGLEDIIAGLSTRKQIRLALMRHAFHSGPEAELKWIITETNALTEFHPSVSSQNRNKILDAAAIHRSQYPEYELTQPGLPDIDKDWVSKPRDSMEVESYAVRLLWQQCRHAVRIASQPKRQASKLVRPRCLLFHALGHDIDRVVNDFLIRFTSAFVDQGYSSTTLPNRDQGFFECFKTIYRAPSWTIDRWLRPLSQWIRKHENSGATTNEIIYDSLRDLGIDDGNASLFVRQTLLSLGGWAGIVCQLESRQHAVVHPLDSGALRDFLAVRLMLERLAIIDLAHSVPATTNKASRAPTHELIKAMVGARYVSEESTCLRDTLHLFQLAQTLGWTSLDLESLNHEEWQALVEEVNRFDELHRRRIFQDAWESDFRRRTLSAIRQHAANSSEIIRGQRNKSRANLTDQRPSFQIITCIDDREESFRRHLEETDPGCETFGAAGFFAVAMYYRGSTDAFYKPLCPGVITPAHYVQEHASYTHERLHENHAKFRNRLGIAGHAFSAHSRNVIGGMITGLAGGMASVPLIARVLFPRWTSNFQKSFGRVFQSPPITKLQLERYDDPPGPDELHVGYSVKEMAEVVIRLLSDIGLRDEQKISRLVFICGHGSTSLNNPHESAYCCGACAGKHGGPNARAFARMANDWRVREQLKELGLSIPRDTVFIGSYHNTCNDSVQFYDLDRLPSSHRKDFENARLIINEARARNAHERCRKFESASLQITTSDALRHVESRAEDLSQARPEYNHATNAICVVGRRDLTQGLFLDRRAFLTSYDASTDDQQNSILSRILAAVVPVCAGINLEYYFSKVDPANYGCGSKLPHNLVGLIGVMEGASSDLRTGLSEQMVEIHPPLRMTFIVEATIESMQEVLERNPTVHEMVNGGWVHLALIDPITAGIYEFIDGEFINGEFKSNSCVDSNAPVAQTSRECYAGLRDEVQFMSIRKAVRS